MLNGNGSLSLRKKDLENSKILSTGYTKTVFAHKASAGATGINLSSLTTPTEMSTNGFSNPTSSQLAAAQLLFFRNNLTLVSSARGILKDFISYTVASSTQLNFLGFTALEGEIFVGTIDYSAQTGIKVVDATATPATGTLAAAATDFNIGQSFQTNKYNTTQVGACVVYLDGAQQFRNTGNSSSSTDGNYYEVDNGSGSFSLIRFNQTDPINARSVLVIPNGLLSERPDGSMMAVIETAQGQINSMAAYVATLSGQTTTTVLGSAPSNVDLKTFGDRVLTLESNRARIDLSNTWTVAQPLVGVTNGSVAAAGQIGEEIKQSRLRSAAVSLTSATPANVTATALTLTPGDWDIDACFGYLPTGTTSVTVIRASISTTSATTTGNDAIAVPDASGQIQIKIGTAANIIGSDTTITIPSYTVNIAVTTTFYMVAECIFTASTLSAYGSIRARRVSR